MTLQSKIIREQEIRLDQLSKSSTHIEQENLEMKDQLRTLRDQKDELESNLIMFEQELESKRQLMERQAELTVDERYRSKNEIIKSYFDSNITRILLNSGMGTNDKILELGREIVALKLVYSKLENHLQLAHQECQTLELIVTHQKEQYAILEQKVRESQ